MRKKLSILAIAIMIASVIPIVLAVSDGDSLTPDIDVEEFPPEIWMCDHRVVLDDETEPGRWIGGNWSQNVSSYTLFGKKLDERINNYAFEGEQIVWDVLVLDKNGIEKIEDVFATIGDTEQGEGNDIEVNCILDYIVSDKDEIPESCNARILEEEITNLSDNMAAFYKCILTVETSESMAGEFWVTVQVDDLNGDSGTMDENEFWFFNPVIALSIDGNLEFDNVRPGTDSYSETILVGNDADEESGVLLDMFISGTDFYDSSSSGAKCPTSNVLDLQNFRYFATSGAYSTQNDLEVDIPPGRGDRNRDAESYVNIGYGIGFNNPTPFYDGFEIIQSPAMIGPYYLGNILAPGAEMALTFKLSLPEPCNGDFDSGALYFWGEAI